MVTVPDDVYQTLSDIRRSLKDEGIRPSDGLFKQSLSLLQAKTLLEQRQEVKVEDLLVLQNALWETVEQKEIVSQIVKENAQDKIQLRLEQIEQEAKDILLHLWREIRDLYRYRTKELLEWKERIPFLMQGSKKVCVLFNNHSGGDAVPNAKKLIELLEIHYEGLGPRQMELF